MILIVGLGNPGEKYKNTRHNIGFMTLDKLKQIQNFSDWKQGKKFNAQISDGILEGEKIMLAKPQTFMNNSGKAVKSIINYSKASKDNKLFIIHDDIDLPVGQMKISKNRGSAGHKGVQSIIDNLGSKDFVRFRIGIKPASIIKTPTEKFVLKNFTKDEQKNLEKIIDKTCAAIEMATKQGIEKTTAECNR
jgi:PTH1 family peptidyl-tRNA hydrolase